MVEAAPARAGAMKKGGRWVGKIQTLFYLIYYRPNTQQINKVIKDAFAIWYSPICVPRCTSLKLLRDVYLVSSLTVIDRGGSKSGSRGSGKSNHAKGGGDDNGIGGHGVKTDKPPCVGICHYNRLFGIVTPAPKPRLREKMLRIVRRNVCLTKLATGFFHMSLIPIFSCCVKKMHFVLWQTFLLPTEFDDRFSPQGGVRRLVLPEQAQPVTGAAWGPLEKRPGLSRLISRLTSRLVFKHISKKYSHHWFDEQAWVSQALKYPLIYKPYLFSTKRLSWTPNYLLI